MKKWHQHLGLIYVTIGLWLVALIQFIFRGQEANAQEVLAAAMGDTGTVWQVEVSGNYQYRLDENNAKKLTEEISRALGVTGELEAEVSVVPDNGFLCLCKNQGEWWETQVKYYYLKKVEQSYVTISISMQGSMELCDDYENLVRKLQKDYGIQGIPVIQYYVQKEAMTQQEKLLWENALLSQLKAKVVYQEAADGYYLVYGYTDMREETLRFGDEKMNVNIVFFDDADTDKTTVMVGFPYLPLD